MRAQGQKVNTLNTVLRDDNEILKARIEQLEGMLGYEFETPRFLGLTKQESKLFGLLMARTALVTQDLAVDALYGGQPEERDPRIVDVFICKLRKKLKRWDIKIETVWGLGFRIPALDKAKAKTIMAEQARVEAAQERILIEKGNAGIVVTVGGTGFLITFSEIESGNAPEIGGQRCAQMIEQVLLSGRWRI